MSDARFLDVMARALARLGARKAMVVSSVDGLDELSTSGPTRVVRTYELTPGAVGLPEAAYDDVRGGTPDVNAETTRLARDLAVLNAGAAIYVAGRADTVEEGVRAAEAAVDDGGAARALDSLVRVTGKLAAT